MLRTSTPASAGLMKRQETSDVMRISGILAMALVLGACATARPQVDKEAVDDFVIGDRVIRFKMS